MALACAVAVLVANWLRISTALSEIVVGTVAQLAIGAFGGEAAWAPRLPGSHFWLALAPSCLRSWPAPNSIPEVFRAKWKEVLRRWAWSGFFCPFLGASAGGSLCPRMAWRPSWLAGVALSTTSVAVVYAVMLELGFNQTTYGKAILAACFINDLGTVLALGLIFSPFTM